MAGLRVWITRASPGAEATAARLQATGHAPLVASLLSVRAWPAPTIPLDRFGAVAFTSANAVRAFAAWTPRRDWPVFAVGDATAQAARAIGFRTVSSARGDVAALADQIAAGSTGGLVLHPGGQDRAGDLTGALATRGVTMEAVSLYETVAAAALPQVAADALADGGLDAVLLHSPKAGGVLAALLDGFDARDLERLRAIGLSAACTVPVAGLGFKALVSAARPDEASLLEQLG